MFDRVAAEADLVVEDSTPEIFIAFQGVDWALWPVGGALCTRSVETRSEVQLRVPPDYMCSLCLCLVRFPPGDTTSAKFSWCHAGNTDAATPLEHTQLKLSRTWELWHPTNSLPEPQQTSSFARWACIALKEPGGQELKIELSDGPSTTRYSRSIQVDAGPKFGMVGYQPPEFVKKAQSERQASSCSSSQNNEPPSQDQHRQITSDMLRKTAERTPRGGNAGRAGATSEILRQSAQFSDQDIAGAFASNEDQACKACMIC